MKNAVMKEKSRNYKNGLLNELKRIAAAVKSGNFYVALNPDAFSHEDTEIAGLINEIIGNFQTATEYNLMKYRLANEALGIVLWDMDVVSADPVNLNNSFKWSQKLRHMLGFSDERDFPDVLSSWSDRLHPEDRAKTLGAFAAHINDYTGQTPYNVEYRLMLKNGDYRHYHAFGTTLRDSAGTPLRVAGALMDIDEKKKIEREIAEAEYAQVLIETSPLCCILIDKDFTVLTCNQSAVELFKASGEAEVINAFYDFSPEYQPDGKPSMEAAFEAIGKAHRDGYHSLEWTHKNIDGELIPCDVTIVRVKYKDDYIVAGYAHDLRKQQEAYEQMQILFEAAPLGANLWNRDIQNIKTNEEAVRLFGLSGKQEYLDNFSVLSPEYQPDGELSSEKAAGLVQKAFEEGYVRFEWVHQRLDGEQIPCEITLVRVKYKDDYIVAGYTRDLREIKAHIAEMQKIINAENAISYLSCILNSLEVMISVIDPKTYKLLFINDSMRRHFDVEGEGIGQICYKAIYKRNEICEHCPIAQLEEEPDEINIWEEHNTIKDCFYRNIDRYIYWPDGRQVYMRYSVDITELIAAKNSAEQSNRSKDIFLAHMSHEIRTPMNAILGISEILLFNEQLSADAKEGFIRIYESGNLLLHIINDILDFSKIDADKMELAPCRYDIPSLINDTVQLNHLHNDNRPIDFILHVDENTPIELIGDELRIKQILNNLLSNAFKYTETGEVELSVSAEIEQDKEAVTLIFRVRDTGQGLNEDQVARLFDEYARFNMETNRSISGTGLGMNITKRLIDMMNGEIFVESEAGKGSVFTVRLPQKSSGSAVCGAEVAESLQNFSYHNTSISRKTQIVHEYMPYGRVLVVDDVESNLYVAKGLLIPYRLHIETVKSGFEAIEKIKNNGKYDIVFMDHMMPKMDGIQATKVIREMGYTRPIVALTANAAVGQAEVFLRNGFDGFISKPIDIFQLDASLKMLIRDKHPPDVVEAARQQKNILNSAESTSLLSKDIQLAEIFIRDAKNIIETLGMIHINNYRRIDDLQTYVVAIHAIKSALANVGEMELSGFALKLEQAGRNGDVDVLENETPKFMTSLLAVINKIAPVEDEDDGNFTDADQAFLYEKLLVIQEACTVYGKKTAKDALAELKLKSWPCPVRKLLDSIAKHLLHSDFEEVIVAVRDYLTVPYEQS